MKSLALFVPLAAGLLPAAVFAQSGPATAATGTEAAPQQVVVTGSVNQLNAADAPYAITVIGAEALRSAGPMINLSEALQQVPGLVINNRYNFAQDLQISSRGFGARATFGVRGVRVYSDGIPATMPDGQGQVSHFDIANAERVEVLRGPFSVLYGNSSGGVIALFTQPVKRAEAEAAVDIGEFGLRQLRASVAAPMGNGFDLRVSGSTMETDGFRPHSEAKRTLGSVRGSWQGEQDRVVVQMSSLDQPAQDPLGLSREQFDADPYQVTPQAETFDTRKTTRQTQAGASWRHRFAGDSALRESQLAVYGGERSVEQWLAIAPGTQANPRHGGGVVDFDRTYGGTEGRLTWRWDKLDLVTGVAIDTQRDGRRGYENFIGTGPEQQLGVTGNLRRDEVNRATSRDAFAQAEYALTSTVTASAGVRSGRVEMSTRDRYLANGDDSGDLAYSYTNPVVGLRWKLAEGLQVHASAARGFESPTLAELAYRGDGGGGFNTTLQPQNSRQLEVGAKLQREAYDVDLTLFRADASDEIGVLSNSAGRSSFQNVGHTRRQGVELAGHWRITPQWRTQLAATYLDAAYRDNFLTCAGIPCAAADTPVAAGNRIAGTQRATGFAELAYKPWTNTEIGLEWRGVGKTAVNDVNSDFSAGWGVSALRWLQRWPLGNDGTRLELLARVDNLTDRVYAGSVIVNDSNGRFFETGAPRNALVSLRLLKPL